MTLWKLWAAIAVLLFLADAYALVSFWACVDLGCDAYPGGKEIIEFWNDASLAGFAGFLIAAAFAFSRWRASKRPTA